MVLDKDGNLMSIKHVTRAYMNCLSVYRDMLVIYEYHSTYVFKKMSLFSLLLWGKFSKIISESFSMSLW